MKYINLIFKNEKFKKYQNIIIPVAAFVFGLLILIFVTVPQVTKYLDEQKNLAQIKKDKNFYIQKANLLKQISTDTYKDNLNSALLALPSDQDIPGAINQILANLEANKLILQGMTFSNKGTPTGDVNNYQISIQVQGNIESLKNFVNSLTSAGRILTLSHLEFSSLGNTKIVQSSMEMATYFQPLPEKIGGIDQPISLLSSDEQKFISKIRNNQSVSSFAIPDVAPGAAGKSDPFN